VKTIDLLKAQVIPGAHTVPRILFAGDGIPVGDTFLLVSGTSCVEERGGLHNALILCRLWESEKNQIWVKELSDLTLS
jgi:hypothetical protein